MKTTELNKIKIESKFLFDLISFEDADSLIGLDGIIISHPYTNCGFIPQKDGAYLDLIHKKEDQDSFRFRVFEEINNAKDVNHIYFLINKPYKFLWFKLINAYLSEKDFAEFLSDIWITSENPNDDVNVPLNVIRKYFLRANKRYLMEKEEYDYYKSLPETLTVYRGVSKGRNPNGFSYTTNKKTAEWFQNRFSDEENPGILIEKEINRSDVLAYFNRRNEDEIVVDVLK